MSIVTLVSGGIDSTLMAVLAKEEGIEQHPLFVDYGQLNKTREWNACLRAHRVNGLPKPTPMNLSGFGKVVFSGITNKRYDVYEDAFLPCRNFLFLLAGSAYAYQQGAEAVSIGLLNEAAHIFPDQTKAFLRRAENSIASSIGRRIRILAPLISFYKVDVLRLAEQRAITATYSCHKGLGRPCGKCISCREIRAAREKGE